MDLKTIFYEMMPDDMPNVQAVKVSNEISNFVKPFIEALETIANDEGEVCQRCEGNGKLWADGKAHYPSENIATINCGNCGGEGRIYHDLKQIAIDVLETVEV